jgi:hypothetical protein
VYQDGRDLNTKFSKTFKTFFFPVGEEVFKVLEVWVAHLRGEKGWTDDDPLFPATAITVGVTRKFEVDGVRRAHWSTSGPIRDIFRAAFHGAGLPYRNPHSIRDTLVSFAQALCGTAEQLKAVSQNFGHEKPLTTVISYGPVSTGRQGEIIKSLGIRLEPLLQKAGAGTLAGPSGLSDEELMAQLSVRLKQVRVDEAAINGVRAVDPHSPTDA